MLKRLTISILCLLCLIYLVQTHCSSQQCIGYEKDKASYAALYATCSNVCTDHQQQITDWTFEPCLKAQTKENIHNISIIIDQEKYLLAFTAYDSQRDLVIVSFRATRTNSSQNILLDRDYTQIPYVNTQVKGTCTSDSKCLAHEGFYKGYLALRSRVRQNAKTLLYEWNSTEILITGISLGAALASFAIFDLELYFKQQNINAIILPYTYGQPRIGNQQFTQKIDQAITIFRIVNQADPIPHLPPRSSPNPHLHSPAIFYYFNPGVQIFFQNYDDSQPLVCSGDGKFCSLLRYGSKYNICDHLSYHKINYNKTISCQVEMCKINNYISLFKQAREFETVIGFIGKFLLKLCLTGELGCPDIPHPKPEDQCNEKHGFILSKFTSLLPAQLLNKIRENEPSKLNICKSIQNNATFYNQWLNKNNLNMAQKQKEIDQQEL